MIENILSLFSPYPGEEEVPIGTISFRELLTTFSLSMKGSPRDRLVWTYRYTNIPIQGLAKPNVDVCTLVIFPSKDYPGLALLDFSEYQLRITVLLYALQKLK